MTKICLDGVMIETERHEPESSEDISHENENDESESILVSYSDYSINQWKNCFKGIFR